MYLSAVTAGVVYFAFGVNLFVLPYVLPLIVLPLLVIFAQGPLTKLVERKKDWKPESLGMFIMEGFFELFETLLAYISNTISFLRIGVMAISHAGMMLTVLLLSNNGTSIFGMIIGNIIVIGLETFMSSIQALRLEFYEMFGRFFESGGKPFSPATIDYSSALNKNAE
jgi:V/A-type H+-transporting ATPase subunit I